MLERVGERIVDRDRTPLGSLRAVYVGVDGAPLWLVVHVGRIRSVDLAVPAPGTGIDAGDLVAAADRARVVRGPRLDLRCPLRPGVEAELCEHFGLPPTPGAVRAGWERRSAVRPLGRGGQPLRYLTARETALQRCDDP